MDDPPSSSADPMITAPHCEAHAAGRPPFLPMLVISACVFLSGAAGLLYEVLWMRQLGYLFGNDAQASAATLSAFFLGIGLGSAWWGRRAGTIRNLLRAYALLECGILACALLYFPVRELSRLVYPALLAMGPGPWAGVAVPFLLAVLLVCPAAFFMGGTLPVLGQLLIRNRDAFGRTASLFYGINTLGAAAGALLAGFYLPPVLGYRLSYVVSLLATSSVAITAAVLARTWRPAPAVARAEGAAPDPSSPPPAPGMPALLVLCFLSGCAVLALEVLWTQMFSHVFQNTVYTFAAILVVTLLCMALGALAAHLLARMSWPPVKVLLVLLMAAGIAVACSSFLMVRFTDNLKIIWSREGWGDYILRVFGLTVAVAGLPLFVSGTVFPYLLKVGERHVVGPGQALGRLSAVNTVGAIIGPLLAGFVLLRWLGLWYAIHLVAILYLVAVVCFPVPLRHVGVAWRGAALVLALACNVFLNPGGLQKVRLGEKDELVESWQGAGGVVGVVRRGDHLAINMNGHYGLGSTASEAWERDQTTIPLLLHPEAKSIFFLGLGTGITAGEALSPRYGLERIVSCELSPEVIEAARAHFGEYTRGLFDDPRSTVLAEDGRHYLSVTPGRFDVINADLFLVYRRGIGDLYTLEHFRNAARRLEPGGIFVQWVPLYQLTRPEFHIIARTLLEVFPQVTVWRNNFEAWQEAVALVGQKEKVPLFGPGYRGPGRDARREALSAVEKSPRFRPGESTLLLYYCGNLRGAERRFEGSPLNTEDRPLIEYLTPRSSSMQVADRVVWFSGPDFMGFVEAMQAGVPPEADPALAGLDPGARRAARAGYHLARSRLLKSAFQRKIPGADASWLRQAEEDRRAFRAYWLGDAAPSPPEDTEK